MLNLSNLRITRHAVGVMGERGVEVEEIVEILRRPDVVEPHDGKRRFVGHGLALVIAGDDERPVLVTVLLRRRDQWTNADARKR